MEVAVAVEAAGLLQQNGKRVRVVSMPSTNVFEAQDVSYRDSVLPPSVQSRVAIEAAAPETWWRYVGPKGAVIGMNSFGASAPAEHLFDRFGFTAEAIVPRVVAALNTKGDQ